MHMTSQELFDIRERHEKVRAFLSRTAPEQAVYVETLFADVGILLASVQAIPPPLPAAA